MSEQLSLFPEQEDNRTPETVTWNMWHGCSKLSSGCRFCYMYRRDEEIGKDPTIVRKTKSFNLPVRRYRGGKYRDKYKIPAGSTILTCFSSDFFHPDADGWRDEAWEMMRERSDCSFFMITKRPERIKDHLPKGWEKEFSHVEIAVTCENQYMADKRLPIYLALPLFRFSVMVEPILSYVDLRSFFRQYPGMIQNVSVGGESGPEARICDYAWVLDLHLQCVEFSVPFTFHQTGAKLLKGGRLYEIPREKQHEQAKKSGLDYGGGKQLPDCLRDNDCE